MSIHAIQPETEARIRKQRRNSFIASSVIGILVVVMLMLILSLLMLSPLFKETPTIVTYAASSEQAPDLQDKKISIQPKRKPSSPSSSMVKVIAAATTSPTSVPVPDVEVTVPTMDFGDGDDFGTGWDSGEGFGQAGGGATFFNQKVKAERIAYVIDYSQSMRGERDKLMRDELAKSVEGIQNGMDYQLIFFAGPAWVPATRSRWSPTKQPRSLPAGNPTIG